MHLDDRPARHFEGPAHRIRTALHPAEVGCSARAILAGPDYRGGNLTTNFIAEHPELLEEMKKFEGEVSPMDYSGADPRKLAAAAAAVAAFTGQ